MSASTVVHLPAAPLVRVVEAAGGMRQLHVRDDRLERSFYRARRSGHLTLWAADELAVHALGQHPALVWGDAWWDPPDLRVVQPAVDLAAMHRAYHRRRR